MKRVLFVGVVWGLCGLLLEGALQLHYRVSVGAWLFQRTSLPLWAPDDVAGFRLKPALRLPHRTSEFRTEIITNRDGFRVSPAGEEFARPKPDGVRRILLLGPSFAFGWGVDHADTFLERLREGIPAGDGVLELINAGVPALGPVQQLRWFRREGRTWEPDLVIQIVYGSPEVSADYSEALTVTSGGYLVPREANAGRRLRAAAKRFGVVFYGWVALTRVKGAETKSAVEGAGRNLNVGDRLDPESPEVAESRSFYADFVATVRDAGAEPLVVFLPLAYRVHPEDLPRWRHLGVSDADAGVRRDRALLALLREDGIPIVDVTEDLRTAAAHGRRLYYRVDIHWTPEGHEVAAAAVARHLRTTGRAGVGSR